MIKYFLIFIYFIIQTGAIHAQESFEIDKFLDGVIIEDICSDGDNIWIATNGRGVYKFSTKDETWENFSSENENLQHQYFYSITANDKFVWAGSIDGLFVFDKKRNKWSKRKFGLGGQLGNWIRSLEYDSYENVVWIGRFKYLTKFDIKKRRFTDYDLTISKNEKTNTIKTITVDGDSLVWFGTEAGLHKYDKSKDLKNNDAVLFYDNRFNYFQGDGDEVSISALLVEQGNVWIGSDEFITQDRPNYNIGGLYKYNRRNRWDRFDVNTGLQGNGISCLEVSGNYIWIGTYQFSRIAKEPYGRGLALINRTNGDVKIIRDKKVPDAIKCSYFDGKNIWFGSESGLIKIHLSNKLAQWEDGD